MLSPPRMGNSWLVTIFESAGWSCFPSVRTLFRRLLTNTSKTSTTAAAQAIAQ